MKKGLLACALFALPVASLSLAASSCVEAQNTIMEEYGAEAATIIEAVRSQGRQFEKLVELCDGIGPRLVGSPAGRLAREWAIQMMRADGAEKVREEEVMVTHWVRGSEAAWMTLPHWRPIQITALGNSIGTPADGIEADVVVAADFEEFETLSPADVEGKIVLFNFPMRRTSRDMSGYGEAVAYRSQGPSVASLKGAVACLVRSVGTGPAGNLHTGMTSYQEGVEPIPAAALTMADAGSIARLVRSGTHVRLRLELGARTLPDVRGGNVVGELRGSEIPGEVVVIGGHFDSWDLGTGAHDDGVGCVAAMETLRILNLLGMRPRRTIRVVLFAAEEVGGLRGGNAYATGHADEAAGHIVAIESDGGAGPMIGFGASGMTEEGYAIIRDILRLLGPVGADELRLGGGGPDIGPLGAHGVPLLGVWASTELYFDYHHSEEDVVDNVDRSLLADQTAAMAVMAYILADMETPLPRISRNP